MSITRLDSAASAAASTLAYSVSAGADRLLVVALTNEWDPAVAGDVTGVDYGGQAMIKVRTEVAITTISNLVSVWYLLEAGIAAASGNVITPTYSNTADLLDEIIHAASYAGARQDAQVVVENKGDTSLSANPITTVDLRESSGNLIFGAGVIGENAPEGVASWQSDLTEQTDILDSSSAGSIADRLSTTESNVTVELTWVGPVNRAAVISIHFAQVGFVQSCLREASATAQVSTGSTTFELIPGMELTPGGGDYMAWFSGSVIADGGLPGDIFVAIFVNGVIVAHTERQIHVDSSFEPTTFLLAASGSLVQPTDGQVVDVRWRALSTTDIFCLERTLNLVKLDAADVDQATATADDTTSSATYVQMGSMTITPGAGKYALFFTCSAEGNSGSLVEVAVFVNGSIIQHTERSTLQESSIPDNSECYAIACEVNPGDSEVVEIRWRRSTGVATVHARTLTLWKTEQIQEVSGTADASTTSSTYVQLSPLTITPDADQYLVIASGHHLLDAANAENLFEAIFEDGVLVAHTERQAGNDSSTGSTEYTWATNGIVNVNGSQVVEIRFKREVTDTLTVHERTMLLISCLALVEKDVTEAIDLEIDPEVADLLGLIDRQDLLDGEIGEGPPAIDVEGIAQDDLDLDLGEVVEVEAQAEVEDSLDLEIDPEAAEVSVGLVALDDLDLEIGEDVADLLGIIDAQESLDEEVNEGDPGIGVEGSAQDSLELDLEDQAAILAQAEVVDSLDLEVVEDAAQVAVGIGANDLLDLEILEDPAEVVVVGVVEKIASDLLDLGIDEDTADLLGLIAPIDTTGMGIDEVAEILAKAERLDSLDLSLGEVVDLLGVMDRDDLLDLEIDDQAQVAVILIAQDSLDLEIGEDPGIVIVIGVIEKVASDDLDVEILEDVAQVDVGITDDDSLGLEVVEETADLFGLIEPEDTTGLSAEEVEEILARAERLDTLDVDLEEAADLLARLVRSDSLDLEVVEGPGEVVVGITGVDDLDLEILEGVGQVVVGIQAEDTLSLALIEATTLLGFLERSDDLNIGIVEGEALVFVALTAQDLLDLAIDDQAEVVILAQVEIVASDTLDLSVVEAVGQVVVAIKATDLLDLSVSEVAEVVGFLNRVDIIDLDLGEQADLLAFIQAADDLDIELLDVSDLVIAIQAADQVDLSIEEVAQVFNAITALDVLDLEITEESVLNVIVPQFQGIITKAITLEALRECPITLVATREVVFILEIDPGVQSDH